MITSLATASSMLASPRISTSSSEARSPRSSSVLTPFSPSAVSIAGVKESEVVTSILRCRERILILKRSDKVGTNQGKWAGVSGYVEAGESPEQTAPREIREELSIDKFVLVGRAGPITIRETGHIWTVHPFLFETDSEQVTTDWEHTEHKWVLPSQVKDYDTVAGFPKLLEDLKLV